MSEAQKYEGALYKEKPAKNQRKGKNDPKQNQKPAPNHRAPYVEDATDVDNPQAQAAPPTAPTPPASGATKTSAPTDKQVNVFDFLVTDQTPNASKVSLAESKEQMCMVAHAPSVFEPSKSLTLAEQGEDDNKAYDVAYEENGFSYGAGPIPSPYQNEVSAISTEFMTPAPKKKKDRKDKSQASAATSDKKRKRGHAEKLESEVDTPMMDAPSSVQNHPGTPMLRHSGLTGGLNRMLRSPSVEGEDEHDHPRRRYQDPSSPIKRTRRSEKETNGSDAGSNSIKNRAGRIVSSMFGGSVVSTASGGSNEPAPKAVARSRRRSSSDAEEPQIEVRRPKKSSSEAHKTKRKSSAQTEGDRPSRRLKQIEHERDQGRAYSPRADGEMMVYREPNVPDALQREMAYHFLSLVNKGPESTRGLSVNKTLKRFHKDFTDEYDGDRGRDHGRSRADRERRVDDEKELWRTLRLRRNDRGEVVVFF
ncbi:hypothetical protein AWENTII_008341 [Aspergillus wentii]